MNFIYASTSVVPDRSFVFTLTVIIAGLGTVLATLALLILIFSLFGRLVSSVQEKAKAKKQSPKPDEENKLIGVPLPPPVVETNGVSPEIVAVISAAVYAAGGEGAKITSISRKKPRAGSSNAWAQAAVIQNTKPF